MGLDFKINVFFFFNQVIIINNWLECFVEYICRKLVGVLLIYFLLGENKYRINIKDDK